MPVLCLPYHFGNLYFPPRRGWILPLLSRKWRHVIPASKQASVRERAMLWMNLLRTVDRSHDLVFAKLNVRGSVSILENPHFYTDWPELVKPSPIQSKPLGVYQRSTVTALFSQFTSSRLSRSFLPFLELLKHFLLIFS